MGVTLCMEVVWVDGPTNVPLLHLHALQGRMGGDELGATGRGDGRHVLVHPDDVVKRLKAFVEVESAAPRSGLSGPSRWVLNCTS